MANPRPENGHLRIANELWDALTRCRIPGEQMQCFMFIMRKTDGWGKAEAQIPLSEFTEATGIQRPHVHRALSSLLSKKVIAITKNGNRRPQTFGINKDYEEWTLLPKKVTTVTKNGNSLLPKKATDCNQKRLQMDAPHHSRRKTIKDTIKQQALAVLSHLNEKAGRRFRDASKIEARLKAGGTVEECCQIIDTKLCDPHFQNNPHYMAPDTLFRASKWDKYLNQRPDDFQGNAIATHQPGIDAWLEQKRKNSRIVS